MHIPVAKPFLGIEEEQAAAEAIRSGWVTQGPRVKAFEDAFADLLAAPFACAVSSCTTALHLALLAIGVEPGDIVITVSHSFIATANAVRHCWAEPVFVDIDPLTFNMAPGKLESFLATECESRAGKLYYKRAAELAVGESPLRFCPSTGRVRALLVVHQMGMPCDLATLLPMARKYGLKIVEDAACAIGSEISFDNGHSWEKIGRPHGDVCCFSFHPRKVVTTGDGGMITTAEPEYDQRFRLLRQHGMNVPDYVRHGADRITFEQYCTTGFNYRMTDIQAAIGIEQLKKLPDMLACRRTVHALYRKYLAPVGWLDLPAEPSYGRTNWQSYPVRVTPSGPVSRDGLMQYLLDHGIATRPGIMNAHEEQPYLPADFKLPESERARRDIVLLPVFSGLSESDIGRIAELLKELDK